MGAIANMDRRCSFQVPQTTKTSGGAPQKTFTHSFFTWCSRELVGDGTETYANERLISPYRYKYRTHYRSDIDETMRISDDGELYNILAVNSNGLFLDILAEKISQ